MNYVKYLVFFLIISFSIAHSRSAHALNACENSPIPAGWVTVSVNSATNNPCAPNRQLTIAPLPTNGASALGCSNSSLPADWVYSSIVSGSQCAPYKNMSLLHAGYFTDAGMCDMTPVPPGHVVSQVSINNSCAPSHLFQIHRVLATDSSYSAVCDNSSLPSDWAFYFYNTSNQCAPYKTIGASKYTAASGLMCDLSAVPSTYVITSIMTRNECSPHRTFSIIKISSSTTGLGAVCSNSTLPPDWVYTFNTSSSQCAPYKTSSASNAANAGGIMCEMSPVPVGYVVTGAINSNNCAPYRTLTISKV